MLFAALDALLQTGKADQIFAHYISSFLVSENIPEARGYMRNNLLLKWAKVDMTTLTVPVARAKLYKLPADTAANHKPLIIKGERCKAVLLAEDDRNAIYEELDLL